MRVARVVASRATKDSGEPEPMLSPASKLLALIVFLATTR
jgi:hypothetical protein